MRGEAKKSTLGVTSWMSAPCPSSGSSTRTPASDVAHPLDDNSAREQRRRTHWHGETHKRAMRLHEGDHIGNRLQEISAKPQEHERKRNMKRPADDPYPFVRFEQAPEQDDLAQHPQGRAGSRRGRRRARDLKRRISIFSLLPISSASQERPAQSCSKAEPISTTSSGSGA
jgi:hypothetical protein